MILTRTIHGELGAGSRWKEQERSWEPGITLEDVAPAGASVAAMGGEIHLRASFSRIPVPDESVVSFACLPGGDSIKNVLDVLNVARYAMDPFGALTQDITAGFFGFRGAGGAQYGFGSGLPGRYAYAAGRAAASPVKRFLWSSMLPGLGLPSTGKGGQQSGSYAFGEPQTVLGTGAPIPVVYGRHDFGGKVVALWTEAVGDEGPGTHWLNMLVVLSYGPIYGIGDYNIEDVGYTNGRDRLTGAAIPDGLKIDGQDAREIEDIEVSFRYGNTPGGATQTPMPGFESTVIQSYHNFELLYYDLVEEEGGPQFIIESKEEVTGFNVDIQFPGGLFRSESDDDTIKIRQRVVDFYLQIYEWNPVTLTVGALTDSAIVSIRAGSRDAVYRTLRVRGLDRGFYRLIVSRLSKDDGTNVKLSTRSILVSTCEVSDAAVGYQGLSVGAVRVRASQRLSGGLPTVIWPMLGRLLPVWNGSSWDTEYSRNQIWAAIDALTNATYGRGGEVTLDSIESNIDEWDDAADECDELIPPYSGAGTTEKRYQFDGIFDVQVGSWEAAVRILETARIGISRVGATIRPTVFRSVSVPDQVFAMSNIVKGSFAFGYRDNSQTPTRMEVQFPDASHGYEMRTVAAYRLSGGKNVVSSQTLIGITRETQARRAATYFLRSHWPQEWVRFTAPMAACSVLPGDVLGIQHDLPAWGESGRIAEATAGSITLDREVTFLADRAYVYRETNPSDDSTLTKEIAFGTETTTDTLSFGPLHGSYETAPGRVWCIGERGADVRLFRVISMSRNEDHTYTLDCIENLLELFSDDGDAPEEGEITPPSFTPPGYVTSLTVAEAFESIGRSRFTASWTAPTGADYQEIIHVDRYGREQNLGRVAGDATSFAFSMTIQRGKYFRVVIVAKDSWGTGHTVASCLAQTEGTGWRGVRCWRDDSAADVLQPPDTLENGVATLVSGNQYTISWDALTTTPDEYEARIGGWTGGRTVYKGTATSFLAMASRRPHVFYIRARTGNLYSPACLRVSTTFEEYSGYTVLGFGYAEDTGIDEGLNVTDLAPSRPMFLGTVENGSIVSIGVNRWGLRQAQRRYPLAFTSLVRDCGSVAEQHVSCNWRCASSLRLTGSTDLAGSFDWVAPTGQIGPIHSKIRVFVYYSDTASTVDGRLVLSAPAIEEITDRIGQEVILISGRYFQFAIIASPRQVDEEGDNARAVLLEFSYCCFSQP